MTSENSHAAQATSAKASGAAARPVAHLADQAPAEGPAGTASKTPSTAAGDGAASAAALMGRRRGGSCRLRFP